MNTENMFIPEEAYHLLPPVLKHHCLQISHGAQRDVYLLAMLAMYGSLFDNYCTSYANGSRRPNLSLFIADPSGTANGMIEEVLLLCDKTEEDRLEFAKDCRKEYPEELAYFKQQEALFFSKKRPDMPAQPEPPRDYKYYIPTGIPATALMQQLHENKGFGMLCETGAGIDNTQHNVKQLFRNLLPKIFLNEPVSFYNTHTKSDIRIKTPRMGVILSGNYDQLLDIIPNTALNLHPKFCFYTIQEPEQFNPFDAMPGIKQDNDLWMQSEDVYLDLNYREPPVYFITNEQQQQLIWAQCRQDKNLALICLRIAMLLEILHYNHQQITKTTTIPCSDHTLQCAISIAEVLRTHNDIVYKYLEEHGRQPSQQQADEECEQQIIELHNKGMSVRKIAAELLGDESKFMRVQRVIKKL